MLWCIPEDSFANFKVLRRTETIPLLPCPQWLELADSTQCIGCDYCCEQCAGLEKQSCVYSSNPQQAQYPNWNDSTLSTASSSIFQPKWFTHIYVYIYIYSIYTYNTYYIVYNKFNLYSTYSNQHESTLFHWYRNNQSNKWPSSPNMSNSVLFSKVPSSLGHEHRKATGIVSVSTSQVLNHSEGLK